MTGDAPGEYFLAAQIRDPLGQILEDVVAVTVPAAAPETGAFSVPGTETASSTGAAATPATGGVAAAATGPGGTAAVGAELGPAEVVVAPGSAARLTLRLHNPAAGPVRGEAQLLSPFGTWGDVGDDLAVEPWIQGFSLPAGATDTLHFTVRAPAGARPGGRWWALARVAAVGRVAYTAAVALTTPAPGGGG